MKIGLIRCRNTEDACAASRCLEVMRLGGDAFAAVGEELVCVGVNSCGGCPGDKAGARAQSLVKRGAQALAVASCISLGSPHRPPCPYAESLLEAVRSAAGKKARVFGHTHKRPRKRIAKAAEGQKKEERAEARSHEYKS